MPGFNQVALARHAHGLLVAVQQVQARAPPGARPVPPLLHEHISVITAALQRIHEQFSLLIGGDPLVVTRGDGGIRPDDVLHLARWWQDGRLTHLIHKIFLLAVRDVATVCAKAPGGPSSVNVSRAPSRSVSRASSSKLGNPISEAERAQRSHAAFEQFLGTPKAAQCISSLVVLQGVLQLVLDALQLLRNRPPGSLQPPPPLPPPPPPAERDSEQGEGEAADAIDEAVAICVTVVAGSDAAGSNNGDASAAISSPGQPESTEATEPRQPALAAESSSTGSIRSRGNRSRQPSDGPTNSPRAGGATAQGGKLPPLKPGTSAAAVAAPAAAAASGTQRQPSPPRSSSPSQPRTSSPQPRASSPPQPLRPEDERYQRLCARHRHAERLYLAWSGLQDAVLDLLCNSPLLMNLTELLRYTAALLALPSVGGGAGAGGNTPRTVALWRQVWSVVPPVAALAHAIAASAAVSLLPGPPAAVAASAGGGPPPPNAPPTPLTDPTSAAVLLAALADSSLVPACCDLVLAVSRTALQNSSAARNNVALAAQQLLSASLRLSAVAEAGDAFKPQPPLQPAAATAMTLEPSGAEASAPDGTVPSIPDPTAPPGTPPNASGEVPAERRVSGGGGGSGAALPPSSQDGDGGGEMTYGSDATATELENGDRTTAMSADGQRLSSNDGAGGGAAGVRTSGPGGVRVSDESVRISRASGDAVGKDGTGNDAGDGAMGTDSMGKGSADGAPGSTPPPPLPGPTGDDSASPATASAAVLEQPRRSSGEGAAPAVDAADGGTAGGGNTGPDTADGSAAAGDVVASAMEVPPDKTNAGTINGAAAVATEGIEGSQGQGGKAPGSEGSHPAAQSAITDVAEDASGVPPGVSETAVDVPSAGLEVAEESGGAEAAADAAGPGVEAAAADPRRPTPLPPLPAGAAAALMVLSTPAVQYFLCERQASAVVQAYSEIAATAPPPPPNGKTSVTAAISASASLSTTWIVEPMLTGTPPSSGVTPPAASSTGSDAAAAAASFTGSGGGVSVAGVLDVARSCGLDLLPVPALPWSVPIEAALVALPDMRTVQQTFAKAASTGGAPVNSGGPMSGNAALDASVGPLGHHLRTESAGGAVHSGPMWSPQSLSAGPSAATISSGPSGPQIGRRRLDNHAQGPSSGGGAGRGGMLAGTAVGPKLPPLRMPLRQLDSDARRREAQKVQRQQEATEKEAQLVSLVKATAVTWQGLIEAAATAVGPAAGGDGEDATPYVEYVYGAAGRPATPSGHVPSASRVLLQLISAAAVCRAASTAEAAASQSDGGRAGSPPRVRSGRAGRVTASDAGAGGGDNAPEESLAELLAMLIRNLTASHRLCTEPERTTLHEQLAALLAAALAASQAMVARTGSPDVSTPLVAVPEACLAWMAEAERQRALELAVSEREMEAADLAAAEAEAIQLERALTRPDEEFTDEEYAAWQQRLSGTDDGGSGLSRAAEAVARAAAVRLTAAARDAARLRVAVALCEACVRFLVAHHQGMVATLLRAGLLRPGLKLRQEHTRHAALLQQTLEMLAHLAACCASAVAEAHAPPAAGPQPPPHRSPLALAAASHAMVATAVDVTYTPVLRSLHSALLSVRKCLAVCSQQLAAAGGAALGLAPVADVCAVLCAFPGRLVAQLLPAHELVTLRHASGRASAGVARMSGSARPSTGDGAGRSCSPTPSAHAAEADASASAAEAEASTSEAAASPKETALEPSYGNGGATAAPRAQFAWGLEPIIEVSELSSAISSYPSQAAQQQQQQRGGNAQRRSLSPTQPVGGEHDGVEGSVIDDLDSPAGGGGGGRAGADDPEQQGYEMDFEDPADTQGAASDTRSKMVTSRRASGNSTVSAEQAARAAAAVEAAVPYVARAIASSALHTTVPAAWRVFTNLFLQLASVEMAAEEEQRLKLQQQQQQQHSRSVGLSWADAPCSSCSGTNDGATEYSTYSFNSSRADTTHLSQPVQPPQAAAAGPVPAALTQGSESPALGSALSAEQLAALSNATTGLWDLLHVLLAVHRGAGAPWPAEAFALPAERETELRRVVRELQQQPPPPPPPPQQQQPVQEGAAQPPDGNGPAGVGSRSAHGSQDGVGPDTAAAAALAGGRASGSESQNGGLRLSSSTGGGLLLSGTTGTMQDEAGSYLPSPWPSGDSGDSSNAQGAPDGSARASSPNGCSLAASHTSGGSQVTMAQDGATEAAAAVAARASLDVAGPVRNSSQNGTRLMPTSALGRGVGNVDGSSDERRSDGAGVCGTDAKDEGALEQAATEISVVQVVSSELPTDGTAAGSPAGEAPGGGTQGTESSPDNEQSDNAGPPSLPTEKHQQLQENPLHAQEVLQEQQQQQEGLPSEAQQQPADAAAATTAATTSTQSLADKVPAWREATMLLEQVFSLSEAWQELKAAENALEENSRAHAPRLLLGDVPAPVPSAQTMESSPKGTEPSAAALLASFLRGGDAASGNAPTIKTRRLQSSISGVTAAATAAAAIPTAPPKLILTAAEAARAMAGAPSGVGGRATSPSASNAATAAAAAAAALPSGCSYSGCTTLAGASEVAQGRALVCRCERVSYCSSTCQMLDWMDSHHKVCKGRPPKNSVPASKAALADAMAAQAAAGFTAAATAEPIGAAAAMGAAVRGSFGRRAVATRR
ncbi:hypothetical protein VOLCADRAFT_98413 [Volvox carteri f. nagariensis]|uniref:MYND-type domain-containing protein n=1 Tax=Volvox carteri f. nagariensis TaxID=3068 RepID=D8UFA1_VOLCA|nr:uncharacterized protein VOLCADRAFT_98413 [Volvox carteri f. nagariensis]EFJ41569.1 hypothetical protein VOLCADRAFT_98413 [Volvox carteri f. nagariensis]|eukprot:XP_002957360.1 hypothetical protein VOLCADRAFT_98413 [Volvox carteri f. nagariensis]